MNIIEVKCPHGRVVSQLRHDKNLSYTDRNMLWQELRNDYYTDCNCTPEPCEACKQRERIKDGRTVEPEVKELTSYYSEMAVLFLLKETCKCGGAK